MSAIMQEYWDSRYVQQKEMTVGHYSFSKKKLAEVTDNSVQIMTGIQDYFKGKKILDFGCGVGRFTDTLKVLSENGLVYGVDINQWAIDKATKTLPEIDFRHFDGEKIPFPTGFFNVIFTWTVLQHIPNEELEKVIIEFRRVLKNDGHIIVYENTTKKDKNAHHIWFRDIELYSKLMTVHAYCWREHTTVCSDIDGTGEEHSLMVFGRELS